MIPTEMIDEVHGELVRLVRDGELRVGDERRVLEELVRRRRPLDPPAAVAAATERVLARVIGLGVLEPLLADPTVTEIMVNGPGPVWVERDGELERTQVVIESGSIAQLVERIVAPLGRRVDRASPSVDARLPDGSRVHVIVPPLAVDGPCLTIRRFRLLDVRVEAFCPASTAALLRWAVRARLNVLVSGGTGAGKTTLLNALAAALPAGERVITIEDAAELRLVTPHVVRLEARPANADGIGLVTIRDLVREALRMRPDRILVGEVRGPEALDMVQAMNTGHEGSLSTCHANGPADALRRLEAMIAQAGSGLSYDAIADQIDGAIDLVVQVARRPGGQRRIVAVDRASRGPERGWILDRVADEAGLRPEVSLAPRNSAMPTFSGSR